VFDQLRVPDHHMPMVNLPPAIDAKAAVSIGERESAIA